MYRAVPLGHGRLLTVPLPDAELAVIPGGGHLVLEQLTASVELLAGLLVEPAGIAQPRQDAPRDFAKRR